MSRLYFKQVLIDVRPDNSIDLFFWLLGFVVGHHSNVATVCLQVATHCLYLLHHSNVATVCLQTARPVDPTGSLDVPGLDPAGSID